MSEEPDYITAHGEFARLALDLGFDVKITGGIWAQERGVNLGPPGLSPIGYLCEHGYDPDECAECDQEDHA